MGHALVEDGDLKGAEQIYHAGLRVDPDYPNLHFALSLLYRLTGDDDSSLKHHQLAFVQPLVTVAPYHGSGPPIDVLMILAAHGGNIVTGPFFDRTVVRVYTLVAEGYRRRARNAARSRVARDRVSRWSRRGRRVSQISRAVHRRRALPAPSRRFAALRALVRDTSVRGGFGAEAVSV